MNTPGTIDHPMTHDPKLRHRPSQDTPMKPDFETSARSHADVHHTRQNRTREMQLMPESLARAHMNDRLREATAQNRALRVTTHRRLQRRAERAALRAKRALAMAVMQ